MLSHFYLPEGPGRRVQVVVIDQGTAVVRPYKVTLVRPSIDNRKDFLMALEQKMFPKPSIYDLLHLVMAFRPPAGPDRFVPVASKDVLDDEFYEFYFGTDIPRLMVFQTRCHSSSRQPLRPRPHFTDEPVYVRRRNATTSRLIPEWTILQVRKLQRDLDATLPLDAKPTLSAPEFIGVPLLVPVHENNELSWAEVNEAINTGMRAYMQTEQWLDLSRVNFVENESSNTGLCKRLPADVTLRDAATIVPTPPGPLRFLPLLTAVLPSNLADLFSPADKTTWPALLEEDWPAIWTPPPPIKSQYSLPFDRPQRFGRVMHPMAVPKAHVPPPASPNRCCQPTTPNTPHIIKSSIPALRPTPPPLSVAAVQDQLPTPAIKMARDVATYMHEDGVAAVARGHIVALDTTKELFLPVAADNGHKADGQQQQQQQCQQQERGSRGTKRDREESVASTADGEEDDGLDVVSTYRHVRQRTSGGFQAWCRRTAATAAAVGHYTLRRVVPLVAGVAVTTVALAAAVEGVPDVVHQVMTAAVDVDSALLKTWA